MNARRNGTRGGHSYGRNTAVFEDLAIEGVMRGTHAQI